MNCGPEPVLDAWTQRLQHAIQQRQAAQLLRARNSIDSACEPSIQVGGQRYRQFCSNDYLGLANHPKVVAALQNTAQHYGVGSGASHLISGHSVVHEQLEQALAEYTGRPRALLFSTGYMANLGTVQALLRKGDHVFEDKLNHASLLDAGLHSGAYFKRYLHNDVASLQTKLARVESGHSLVVTDGVFSMDGDIAPVSALATSCQQSQAWLMVDDAHGFGVLNQGRGLSVHGLDEVPIYMATLGKALGCFGAFVAGTDTLIETLIQFARPYIYTTAVPAAVAGAALQALTLVQQESWRAAKLAEHIEQFKQLVTAADFSLMPSDTAIQPLLVGSAATALDWSAALRQRGFWVTAIRPPTVAQGQSRLRITLSAAHSSEHLQQLVAALIDVRRELPAVPTP